MDMKVKEGDIKKEKEKEARKKPEPEKPVKVKAVKNDKLIHLCNSFLPMYNTILCSFNGNHSIV
jgi:hypothetical protein